MKPSLSCRQNQHCNLWLMGERGKFATLTKESGCLKHFVAYSEITAKQSRGWLLKHHARQYYRHERKVREAEERIPVFLTFEIAPKVDKYNTFDKKNVLAFVSEILHTRIKILYIGVFGIRPQNEDWPIVHDDRNEMSVATRSVSRFEKELSLPSSF